MYMVIRKTNESENKISRFEDDEKPSEFTTNDVLNSLSVDVIEVIDYSEKGIASFNRIYQIFEGELHLIINNENIIIRKGDGLYIEKGTKYEITGTFKAIAVNKVAH